MAAESTYSDLAYTNYPVREDTHHRMTDVSASTVEYVKLFEYYYNQNDFARCKELLINHPELTNCMFDADKYNQLRDAVIALERYYLDSVESNLSNIKEYINMTLNNDLSQKFNINYEVSNNFINNWQRQLQ